MAPRCLQSRSCTKVCQEKLEPRKQLHLPSGLGFGESTQSECREPPPPPLCPAPSPLPGPAQSLRPITLPVVRVNKETLRCPGQLWTTLRNIGAVNWNPSFTKAGISVCSIHNGMSQGLSSAHSRCQIHVCWMWVDE